MPANYEIRPHTHPAIEHVTVLEGELYFGMGEKFNKEMAKKLTVGSVAVMPQGHKHYAFTQDKPATIQLHGIGPWGITYVNPSDDPRRKMSK
jgi:quercetin dioxygenase-like cupin family protein